MKRQLSLRKRLLAGAALIALLAVMPLSSAHAHHTTMCTDNADGTRTCVTTSYVQIGDSYEARLSSDPEEMCVTNGAAVRELPVYLWTEVATIRTVTVYDADGQVITETTTRSEQRYGVFLRCEKVTGQPSNIYELSNGRVSGLSGSDETVIRAE